MREIMSNIPLECSFILKTKHWVFKGLRLVSLFLLIIFVKVWISVC